MFNFSAFAGMATRSHTLNHLLNENLKTSEKISKFIYKQYRKVNRQTNLGRISRILEREPFVVVTDVDSHNVETVVGVITKDLILDYLVKKESETAANIISS